MAEYQLVQFASGFTLPVDILSARDGSGRLFVVEQNGTIKILKNGVTTGTFLNISNEIRSPASGGGQEQGLLGLAFPPYYGQTVNHFFVYYTRTDGDNQLSQFTISGNPDVADPASEVVIQIFPQPYWNHNGGQLAFGPDGYLYIGKGDGGGVGDPGNNAQNPNNYLGKLLRVNVDPSPPKPIMSYFLMIHGSSSAGPIAPLL